MATLNWSMSLLGYPEHRRGASVVIGLAPMSTHEVLRFAEHIGFATGWILAEGQQPQLERVRNGKATWVALAEMFADRRVVMTDGMASGSLIFVAGPRERGDPPTDRPLTVWADGQHLPWVEIIDNEVVYWGGLGDDQVDRLLCWLLEQRPVDGEWRDHRLAPGVGLRLRQGLFSQGWLRNLGLVKTGRKPSVDLWGGVHGTCLLDHAGYLAPSLAGTGVRLTRIEGRWEAKDLTGRCPLSDETGKMAR